MTSQVVDAEEESRRQTKRETEREGERRRKEGSVTNNDDGSGDCWATDKETVQDVQAGGLSFYLPLCQGK